MSVWYNEQNFKFTQLSWSPFPAQSRKPPLREGGRPFPLFHFCAPLPCFPLPPHFRAVACPAASLWAQRKKALGGEALCCIAALSGQHCVFSGDPSRVSLGHRMAGHFPLSLYLSVYWPLPLTCHLCWDPFVLQKSNPLEENPSKNDSGLRFPQDQTSFGENSCLHTPAGRDTHQTPGSGALGAPRAVGTRPPLQGRGRCRVVKTDYHPQTLFLLTS